MPRSGDDRDARRARRRSLQRWIAVALLLGAALAGWLLWGRKDILPRRPARSLLLITVDTLRADRLGAYGFAGIRTPNIDRLAREGILFESCISPTPLTLPSHTSLLSGTYPLHHGVRDNGSFVVPASLPTLPTLLAPRGFRTGAVVASFVLDSRWGLNRGFQDYYDRFETHQRDVVSIGDIQRPANEIVDAALSWLEKNGGSKFFLWVHFYDPHDPYEPPTPFREQYAEQPYLGEIAFVDSEIGRLLRWFDARERSAPTLIVFAGDHGESLGEHEEHGHGYFVYDATLHVPLLLRLPGREFAGTRHSETVSLVDVLPTVTELLGMTTPAGIQGQSLGPLIRGGRGFTERPAYAETYYPRLHFGWSELHALQDRRLKLIASSDPEVYDLQSDSVERENLASSNPDLRRRLQRELAALSQSWSKAALPVTTRQADPETIAKLASLGYLTGAAPIRSSDLPRPPPRARIGVYNRLLEARARMEERSFSEAERTLKQIVEDDGGVVDAYTALGSLYLRQKRFSDAAGVLRKAVELKPSDPLLAISLALAELGDHRPGEAEKSLLESVGFFPGDSRFYLLLGKLAADRNDHSRADRLLARALELDPHSASIRSAVSEILLNRGDAEGAIRRADEALALDPKARGAHYCRARVLSGRGQLAEAWLEHAQEIENSPDDPRSFQALMTLSRRLQRFDEEERRLRSLFRERPELPLAYLYLAKNYLDRGERYDEAIALAEGAIQRKPEAPELTLGYYVLADLYNRRGQADLSREFATRARQAERGGR